MAASHNEYNMNNMHNTYNTQQKVYWRLTVELITCIKCITRISRIKLRTMMIEGKGLDLITRITCITHITIKIILNNDDNMRMDGPHIA